MKAIGIKEAITFLKSQGYKILKLKSMKKQNQKSEKKRINRNKRYGGKNSQVSLQEKASAIMMVLGGNQKLNPNYHPHKHTKQTYRGQQRDAKRRKQSKAA